TAVTGEVGGEVEASVTAGAPDGALVHGCCDEGEGILLHAGTNGGVAWPFAGVELHLEACLLLPGRRGRDLDLVDEDPAPERLWLRGLEDLELAVAGHEGDEEVRDVVTDEGEGDVGDAGVGHGGVDAAETATGVCGFLFIFEPNLEFTVFADSANAVA
ncbi:hypothetical protein GP486_007409, partial [Trichoglossum hirsutum]